MASVKPQKRVRRRSPNTSREQLDAAARTAVWLRVMPGPEVSRAAAIRMVEDQHHVTTASARYVVDLARGTRDAPRWWHATATQGRLAALARLRAASSWLAPSADTRVDMPAPGHEPAMVMGRPTEPWMVEAGHGWVETPAQLELELDA